MGRSKNGDTTMTCGFCGSRNGDGEHRCRRCGRRPGDTLTSEYVHRTQGPLAMQPVAQEVEPPQRTSAARPFQPSLFPAASNVIPFEAYSPVEPQRRQQRAEGPPRRKAAPKRQRVEGQGELEFIPSAPPKARTLSTTVEAMIYCDATVATPLHRAVAAALDSSMVLIAYGAFMGVFLAMGGSVTLNKLNVAIFGGVLLLFALVYGLLWAISGAPTMGQRWTNLKVLTFEGFEADWKHRVMRLIGSALGFCSVVGVAWSFIDEEGLGWQDYISHTFPTPCESDNLVLVRR